MEAKELKLRKYKLSAKFEPAAGAKDTPKEVVAKGTKIFDSDYLVAEGKLDTSRGKDNTNVDATKTGISGKVATGCT